MSNYDFLVTEFSLALTRLEEVLAQPKNDFLRDSAIQRFEFTPDLSWKSTQAYLIDVHGLASKSPKTAFRNAFQVGLIEYDDTWITLVYKRDVYSILPTALKLFNLLLAKLLKSAV